MLNDPAHDSDPQASEPAICPLCREAIHPEAVKCPHCRSLLRDFQECPSCGERAVAAATKCPFCSEELEGAGGLELEERELVAEPLGAMICESSITALFFPPRLQTTGKEVSLSRWTLFGLRRHQQRVSARRVASVRFNEGVFWASLTVETYGGSLTDLSLLGLNKKEAREMAAYLESFTKRQS